MQHLGLTRVLIVEDDKALGELLKEEFESFGIKSVDVCDNAHAAYNLCTQRIRMNQIFHLIVTDLKMPRMSGIDFIRKLRTNEYLRNVPVVMVTAYGDESIVKEAIDLGIVDFVAKPYDSGNFRSRITKILQDD